MIPVARRAVEVVELIEQGRWFSLVSGRQTGKTTVVQSLAAELTARGDRLVLWVDLETARGSPARSPRCGRSSSTRRPRGMWVLTASSTWRS